MLSDQCVDIGALPQIATDETERSGALIQPLQIVGAAASSEVVEAYDFMPIP